MSSESTKVKLVRGDVDLTQVDPVVSRAELALARQAEAFKDVERRQSEQLERHKKNLAEAEKRKADLFAQHEKNILELEKQQAEQLARRDQLLSMNSAKTDVKREHDSPVKAESVPAKVAAPVPARVDTPGPAKVAAEPIKTGAAPTKAVPTPSLVNLVTVDSSRKSRRRRSLFPIISFALLFMAPTLLFAYFFNFVASDQYRVETQFAVRGAASSSIAEIGLKSLLGGVQISDSYIVSRYINSRQVIQDIKKNHNIDLRQFYSRPIIDRYYRISPTLSMEEFERYWKSMISVEFNVSTGNSSLVIFAFTDEDARRISELVLAASQQLVNDLSRETRERLISTAQKSVNDSETRLNGVQQKLTILRNREQTVDPQQAASLEVAVVSELEKQLADLKTRQRALASVISKDSPSSRVIARQIQALESQLVEQRARIGTGESIATAQPGGNLSGVVSEYAQLYIDLEFATASYTAALTSLEAATAQAQQQERYFATFVAPYAPDATIYPKRILSSFLAAIAFLVGWLIFYFLGKSVYDHAV